MKRTSLSLLSLVFFSSCLVESSRSVFGMMRDEPSHSPTDTSRISALHGDGVTDQTLRLQRRAYILAEKDIQKSPISRESFGGQTFAAYYLERAALSLALEQAQNRMFADIIAGEAPDFWTQLLAAEHARCLGFVPWRLLPLPNKTELMKAATTRLQKEFLEEPTAERGEQLVAQLQGTMNYATTLHEIFKQPDARIIEGDEVFRWVPGVEPTPSSSLLNNEDALSPSSHVSPPKQEESAEKEEEEEDQEDVPSGDEDLRAAKAKAEEGVPLGGGVSSEKKESDKEEEEEEEESRTDEFQSPTQDGVVDAEFSEEEEENEEEEEEDEEEEEEEEEIEEEMEEEAEEEGEGGTVRHLSLLSTLPPGLTPPFTQTSSPSPGVYPSREKAGSDVTASPAPSTPPQGSGSGTSSSVFLSREEVLVAPYQFQGDEEDVWWREASLNNVLNKFTPVLSRQDRLQDFAQACLGEERPYPEAAARLGTWFNIHLKVVSPKTTSLSEKWWGGTKKVVEELCQEDSIEEATFWAFVNRLKQILKPDWTSEVKLQAADSGESKRNKIEAVQLWLDVHPEKAKAPKTGSEVPATASSSSARTVTSGSDETPSSPPPPLPPRRPAPSLSTGGSGDKSRYGFVESSPPPSPPVAQAAAASASAGGGTSSSSSKPVEDSEAWRTNYDEYPGRWFHWSGKPYDGKWIQVVYPPNDPSLPEYKWFWNSLTSQFEEHPKPPRGQYFSESEGKTKAYPPYPNTGKRYRFNYIFEQWEEA